MLVTLNSVSAAPLETTISQRYSARTYTSQSIDQQNLIELLQAAYSFTDTTMRLPEIGNVHAVDIFVVNANGTFRFLLDTKTLAIWDSTITKETIKSDLTQSWEQDANTILVFVWDQSKSNDQEFVYAETGCMIQNIYLSAVTMNIGACAAGSYDSNNLKAHLKLPSTSAPIMIVPIGMPQSPYSSASPDYTRMNGNLPSVQINSRTYKEALNHLTYSQTWSNQALSNQELSQILWAAYGYSSTGHRTTPSAEGWYPLIIYFANATGTYHYLPESHSVTQIKIGDNRMQIVAATGNQVWAAGSPTIFMIAYNSSRNFGLYSDWYHFWVEIDAGCVIEQILLESSTLNLSANIVSNGFEHWNGTTAQAIRYSLDMDTSIVPMYLLPVGYQTFISNPTPAVSSTPFVNPTDKVPTPSSPVAAPTASPHLSNTPRPTETSNPTVPEYPFWVAILGFIIITISCIALSFKKRTPKRSLTQDF